MSYLDNLDDAAISRLKSRLHDELRSRAAKPEGAKLHQSIIGYDPDATRTLFEAITGHSMEAAMAMGWPSKPMTPDQELLGTIGSPKSQDGGVAASTKLPISGSPEASNRLSMPAANDRFWTEYRLQAVAAASVNASRKAIRHEIPDAIGSLTLSPILGKDAAYLIFQASPDCVEQYAGAHVLVKVDDAEFDLGEVSSDGRAQLRLDGWINFTQPRVKIGILRNRK